jgi:hypothetical protein
MAFQKSAVITDAPLDHRPQAHEAFDVARFMGDITFTDRTSTVYEVHPERKYEKTIKEGVGNCSNLCFGTAYELRKRSIPYDIIFFLPRKEFLDGWGHAIVSTTCTLGDSTFDCLVDVLESGLPMSGNRFVERAELYKGGIADFSIHSLNAIHKTNSTFYGEFLDRSTIGILQGKDIGRYFSFLEKTYIPLGHPKLEKSVYDGLTVLLGVYPRIHVRSIAETFAGSLGTRLWYLMVLWILRMGTLVALLWVVVRLGNLVRYRRS